MDLQVDLQVVKIKKWSDVYTMLMYYYEMVVLYISGNI